MRGVDSVLLLGFGIEGQGTWEYLRGRWPHQPLAIADQRPLNELPDGLQASLEADAHVSLFFGDDYPGSLGNYDVIVKTAGIPPDHPLLLDAAARGAAITSHMELFFESCPASQIIGITGTKGKSTTSALTYGILRRSGADVSLVGNIGLPALPELARHPAHYFVTELSSHQLAPLRRSPHTAVLLDIVPEHLDYYPSFADYVAAKRNITAFQTASDVLVYNADSKSASAIASGSPARKVSLSLERQDFDVGCYLDGTSIVYADGQSRRHVVDVSQIPLVGRFNYYNVMAAISAAAALGTDVAAMADAIASFVPLPHRLTYVGERHGIHFYDDSISTVPEATLSALRALGNRVHTLFLGGHERNLDFSGLARELLTTSVRVLVLFPPSGERIWRAIETTGQGSKYEVYFADSMRNAVELAFRVTPRGAACLLSPAAPSFGLFRDFSDRGDQFRRYVDEVDIFYGQSRDD